MLDISYTEVPFLAMGLQMSCMDEDMPEQGIDRWAEPVVFRQSKTSTSLRILLGSGKIDTPTHLHLRQERDGKTSTTDSS